MSIQSIATAFFASITLAFTGISSASAQIEQIALKDAKNPKWTHCAAGAVTGGAIGGLLGNKLGGKLKSKKFGLSLGKTETTAAGAIVGAAAGCAIFSQLTKTEKKTVDDIEEKALVEGKAEKSWTTPEGKTKSVKSESRVVQIAEKPDLTCKQTTTTISENQKKSGVVEQVHCVDDNGQYQKAGIIL